jgi:phage gp36-like protein
MAYSGLSDLMKEFSATELARITGDPTGLTINIERIEHASDMAEGIIDSYILGRYTLPLTDSGMKILKKISLDISISFLYENAFGKTSLPNTIIWRKNNAAKLLEQLSKGVIKLDNYELIKFNSKERIFDDDLLDGIY